MEWRGFRPHGHPEPYGGPVPADILITSEYSVSVSQINNEQPQQRRMVGLYLFLSKIQDRGRGVAQ